MGAGVDALRRPQQGGEEGDGGHGDSVGLRRPPHIGRSPPITPYAAGSSALTAANRAAARFASDARHVLAEQVLAFRLAPLRARRAGRRRIWPPRPAARPPTSPATRPCSRSARAPRTSPATATTTRSTTAASCSRHTVRCAIHALDPADPALYGRALIATDDGELAAEIGGAVPGLLEQAGDRADGGARRGHRGDRGRAGRRRRARQERVARCVAGARAPGAAALVPELQEPSRRREPVALRDAAGGRACSTRSAATCSRRRGPVPAEAEAVRRFLSLLRAVGGRPTSRPGPG